MPRVLDPLAAECEELSERGAALHPLAGQWLSCAGKATARNWHCAWTTNGRRRRAAGAAHNYRSGQTVRAARALAETALGERKSPTIGRKTAGHFHEAQNGSTRLLVARNMTREWPIAGGGWFSSDDKNAGTTQKHKSD